MSDDGLAGVVVAPAFEYAQDEQPAADLVTPILIHLEQVNYHWRKASGYFYQASLVFKQEGRFMQWCGANFGHILSYETIANVVNASQAPTALLESETAGDKALYTLMRGETEPERIQAAVAYHETHNQLTYTDAQIIKYGSKLRVSQLLDDTLPVGKKTLSEALERVNSHRGKNFEEFRVKCIEWGLTTVIQVDYAAELFKADRDTRFQERPSQWWGLLIHDDGVLSGDNWNVILNEATEKDIQRHKRDRQMFAISEKPNQTVYEWVRTWAVVTVTDGQTVLTVDHALGLSDGQKIMVNVRVPQRKTT